MAPQRLRRLLLFQLLPLADRRDAKFHNMNDASLPLIGTPEMVSLENAAAKPIESWKVYLAVLAVACAVFLACIVTPPSLMDDVDSVHAQIARTMLQTGDWVTPPLDGAV